MFSRKISSVAVALASFMIASCGGGGSGLVHLGGGGGGGGASLSWQQVSVPSGATQISAFAVSGSNHWFIADRNKGFYRSTDQGSSWTAINAGLANTLAWNISLNPATGDLIGSSYSGSGSAVRFYRSTNEGASWTAISSVSLSSATALTGCAFPSNGNVVCGGFWAPNPSSGAWVSTNGGQSTTSVSNASNMGTSVYSLAVNPVDGDLWLGTEQMGIFRSGDNGFTWTQESPADTNVDPTNGIRDGNIYGITFDSSGNVLFSSQGGIWKSSKSSGGYSWSNVLANHNTADGKAMGRDSAGDMFYGHNSDPNDPSSVRCSTDGGANWARCDSGIPSGLAAQDFIVSPADGHLFAVVRNEGGNSGSLYESVSAIQ